MGMAFNEQRRSYLTVLRGRERPAWAPVEQELIEIPGRPGAYKKSKKVNVRRINVPVMIEADNIEDLQKVKEDLADWLITEDAVPLIFDDEPDRTYYAEVTGSFDAEELVNIGKGIISFICTDPYKYGPTHITTFPTEVSTITNAGTVNSYPIFRATATESITFFDVVSEEGFMRLGRPVSVDDFAVVREELIMHDSMQTTTGWAITGTGIVDGAVSGQMLADAYRFYTNNYGVGAGWHGPALSKSVSATPLTDFMIEAQIELLNTSTKNIGRIEIYLIDDSNQVIGKMAMKDVDVGASRNYGEMRLGDGIVNHHIIDTFGDTESTWRDFFGILRLQRVGTEWQAYITKIDRDSGEHYARSFEVYNDFSQQFTRKLSSVVVHLGQYSDKPLTTNRIHDLKVYKINTLTENQIPYIAHAGDVIEFDHSKSLFTINSEDKKELKDFGARPFALNVGDNLIQVTPFESLSDVVVEWRSRYK